MRQASELPLKKVTLNLFEEDVQFLQAHLDDYSVQIRYIVRNYVEGWKQREADNE